MHILPLGPIMSDDTNWSRLMRGRIIFTCRQKFPLFPCQGLFSGASNCPVGVSPLTVCNPHLQNSAVEISLIRGLGWWLEVNKRVLAAVSFRKVLVPNLLPSVKMGRSRREFFLWSKVYVSLMFLLFIFNFTRNSCSFSVDPFYTTRTSSKYFNHNWTWLRYSGEQ